MKVLMEGGTLSNVGLRILLDKCSAIIPVKCCTGCSCFAKVSGKSLE